MVKLIRKYKEVILYLFFGVTTTVVNWAVYALMNAAFKADMTVSNAAAWFVAVLYAFVTNKIFVFESKSLAPKLILTEGLKFISARLVSGAVEILLPTAMVALGMEGTLFGLQGGIAKAAVSVLVIALNYVFSKWLVFRK